jgi:hypothetical protein
MVLGYGHKNMLCHYGGWPARERAIWMRVSALGFWAVEKARGRVKNTSEAQMNIDRRVTPMNQETMKGILDP